MRSLISYSLLAAFTAATLSAATPTGTAAHQHLMLVVSKKLPGITIYDADTSAEVCRAHTGISPHEAAFSNDGQTAFVPVYGSSSVGLPGTDEHLLHFIRTSDCKETGVLDTGKNKRPHGIAIGKQSGNIYVTTEISQSVQIIDPKTQTILGSIPTGSSTSHMIALTPDEKRIYVSNVQSKTVSVLDVPNRKLLKTITTPVENQRMTIDPQSHWFVTNLGAAHEVAFYRTSDNEQDFTVAVDGSPFAGRFSADGKYLYTVGTKDHTIRAWKIDVAAKKAVAMNDDDLGTAIGSLSVDPFNGAVYISDAASSRIAVLDAGSWKVTKRLPADKTPDQIAFTTVR